MSYRTVFDVKNQGTNFYAVFDFSKDLAVGETISTASVAAVVYSGTDAGVAGIILGAATVSGKQVTQTITGGVIGVTYLLICAIATSATKVRMQDGYLAVVQ
jgi:hypothetical protein